MADHHRVGLGSAQQLEQPRHRRMTQIDDQPEAVLLDQKSAAGPAWLRPGTARSQHRQPHDHDPDRPAPRSAATSASACSRSAVRRKVFQEVSTGTGQRIAIPADLPVIEKLGCSQISAPARPRVGRDDEPVTCTPDPRANGRSAFSLWQARRCPRRYGFGRALCVYTKRLRGDFRCDVSASCNHGTLCTPLHMH
jgi:hypothetical protein